MREIKFRAWDKDSEIMLCGDSFADGEHVWQFNGNGNIQILTEQQVDREVGGEHEQTDEWLPLNIHIMQYTGLKDKNGKEIYEGDICEFVFDHLGNLWLLVVEWDNVSARFVLKGNGNSIGLDEFEGSIIGNIYENPELLEQKIGEKNND